MVPNTKTRVVVFKSLAVGANGTKKVPVGGTGKLPSDPPARARASGPPPPAADEDSDGVTVALDQGKVAVLEALAQELAEEHSQSAVIPTREGRRHAAAGSVEDDEDAGAERTQMIDAGEYTLEERTQTIAAGEYVLEEENIATVPRAFTTPGKPLEGAPLSSGVPSDPGGTLEVAVVSGPAQARAQASGVLSQGRGRWIAIAAAAALVGIVAAGRVHRAPSVEPTASAAVHAVAPPAAPVAPVAAHEESVGLAVVRVPNGAVDAPKADVAKIAEAPKVTEAAKVAEPKVASAKPAAAIAKEAKAEAKATEPKVAAKTEPKPEAKKEPEKPVAKATPKAAPATKADTSMDEALKAAARAREQLNSTLR